MGPAAGPNHRSSWETKGGRGRKARLVDRTVYFVTQTHSKLLSYRSSSEQGFGIDYCETISVPVKELNQGSEIA